jgi:hypothetical protein
VFFSGLPSEEEASKLFDFLAVNPETGGLRKMRWKGQGKGKSKAIRIIYFYHDLNMPLFVLAVYSKGELLKLTKQEERLMTKLVKELMINYGNR